jgi:hypothetical protein
VKLSEDKDGNDVCCPRRPHRHGARWLSSLREERALESFSFLKPSLDLVDCTSTRVYCSLRTSRRVGPYVHRRSGRSVQLAETAEKDDDDDDDCHSIQFLQTPSHLFIYFGGSCSHYCTVLYLLVVAFHCCQLLDSRNCCLFVS